MRVFNGQGISFDFNGFNISLDSSSSNSDFVFLSHAHTDHLVKTRLPVLASDLTAELARHRRGYDYELITAFPGLKLVDSGHVLGAKSLYADDGEESLFYTGDFSPHDRFFLKGLEPVDCDKLVIETTYGSPRHDFPHPAEVLAEARDVIEDDLSSGYKVVLWGYALGKAQVLTKLVEGLGSIHAHHKVRQINDICRGHGYELPAATKIDKGADSYVYITPSRRELKNFSNARVYSFTGWGSRGVNDCFKLSDHASFSDLLRFVHECSPDKVFTHHGFSEEFAELLRVEGFDAATL
ncbi:hypothetical protein GF352_00045 [archaeon]|nr:hypothetical protein [archaeon]